MERMPEILAPAGSLDGLYASFQMGADAVYVGTSRFGAREYAKTRDKKWSIKIKSQKQRCRQVQRSDILPMIQWVAVHRYLEENEKQDREYDQQEAKEMFEQMAEEALQKCDMAPLNPRYRLDFVLLSCFGDTEMSYLSEILCEYIQPEEE